MQTRYQLRHSPLLRRFLSRWNADSILASELRYVPPGTSCLATQACAPFRILQMTLGRGKVPHRHRRHGSVQAGKHAGLVLLAANTVESADHAPPRRSAPSRPGRKLPRALRRMPCIGLDRLVNSPAFVHQVDAALEPVLGADRLVAGAQLVAGPSPYGVIAGAALVTIPAAIMLGWHVPEHRHDLPAFWLFMLLATIPSLVHPVVTLATQRPMFVGVSGQHLVYGRLSAFRKRLTNIVVVPYGGGRITGLPQAPPDDNRGPGGAGNESATAACDQVQAGRPRVRARGRPDRRRADRSDRRAIPVPGARVSLRKPSLARPRTGRLDQGDTAR